MDAFAARATDAALGALDSLPGKIEKLDSNKPFKVPADAVFAKMEELAKAEAAKTGGPALTNAELDGIAKHTQSVLASLNSELQKIERWIKLSIPMAEDGGNWGVQVQLEVLKVLSEERKALKTSLDSVASFYKDRAEAIEKFAESTSTKTSTSSNKNTTTGGEKPGSDTKESQSEEKTVSKSGVVEDRVKHLAATDAKWYFCFEDMYDAGISGAAQAVDTVIKNIQKVKNPRGDAGDDGGSRPMHMY